MRISTASTSSLIQSSCSRRSEADCGSVTTIRSVSSRPASLRIEFSSWIRSRTRPSSSSSASSAVSSATVTPSAPATAQPSLPVRSTSTSSAERSWPADAEAAVGQLLELARFERGPHRAELLAELRPEHRQVRLHPQLGRLHLAELDLLDAQLVADLVDMPAHQRRPLDDEPAQRLPQLEPGRGPRLPAEVDDADASRPPRRAAARRARPPPPSGRGTPTRARRRQRRTRHRCSAKNGMTGAITTTARVSAAPERLQGRGIAVPEPSPRPADVPVREIVDEASRTRRSTSGVQYRS